ncbi:MAG: DNA-binding domain-containing protein [Verrucomicrobiota bacterium]
MRREKDFRAVQRAFATAIMRPLTKAYGMQPKWIDGTSTRKAVAQFVKPNDRLSSFERIEIYNRQYWYRLLDSLYEDFPGLRAVMGEARFHRLSIAYLKKYPSTSFTLRDLGSRMEKFLVREKAWTAPYRALARDLVRLEWAHIVAFDGDELPPLEIDALLDGADPATLRLRFQPHITFLACDHPVDDFLIHVRRNEEQRGEASNAVAERLPRAKAQKFKAPKPGKIYLAVHRHEHSVWYKRLEPAAYRLCVALQKGPTLQQAVERSVGRRRVDETFPQTLQGWFAQWASFGWFCAVE